MADAEITTVADRPSGKGVPEACGIKRWGIDSLMAYLASLGEPAYRTGQLVEWLYGSGAEDYSQMSNLPASLRQVLAAEQPLYLPKVARRQVSSDGSRKYLLELADGLMVEAVGIPDKQRLTVCFSTQVGCGMGCSFCATARLGLVRQMAPGEMVDQLTVVARDFGQRVTNAVAMGQGEPFANYNAVIEALRLMNHAAAFGIGSRRLTVSTSGIIPGILSLAAEPEQFRLAVSLHSARQRTRDRLMPGLSGHSVADLQQSLVAYCQASGRRISLEVSLIDGVNDSDGEVAALIGFCQDINCHVNLIPFNPIDPVVEGADGLVADGPDANTQVTEAPGGQQPEQQPEEKKYFSAHAAPTGERVKTLVAARAKQPERDGQYKPTPGPRVREVRQKLTEAGIEASVRRSRGADIAGACGQLAGQA